MVIVTAGIFEQLLSSGTCGCQGFDLTQGDDYKIVMAELSYAEFFLGSHNEDVQRRVVELICSGNYVNGDIDVVSGGGSTHVVHARCRTSFDQRPSLPYNAGMEVGLSPSRKTLLVPGSKRPKVLSESHEEVNCVLVVENHV